MDRQPGPISIKVCMLGRGCVGKSAVTLRFMYDEFVEDYEPTKCAAFKKRLNLEGTPVEVDIMDTAGQDDYAGVQDQYYRYNEGFLVVFSITDMDSFKAVPYILDRIMQCRGSDTTPVVLVGNKCDLEQERQVSWEMAVREAQQWHVQYMETSAKIPKNVNEAYHLLIRELVQRKLQAMRAAYVQPVSSEKKCCCTLL